ncbi:hypothetical protein LINPERHAP1_LOCUS10115 [Linum perenne]
MRCVGYALIDSKFKLLLEVVVSFIVVPPTNVASGSVTQEIVTANIIFFN